MGVVGVVAVMMMRWGWLVIGVGVPVPDLPGMGAERGTPSLGA